MMSKTKTRTLLILGLVGLAAGYLFDLIWEIYGQVLPGVPWLAILGMLILSGMLLMLGLPIKDYRDGNRSREIDMLQAARVAMMAKAAAFAGAFLSGWYAGAALYLFTSGGGIRASAALDNLVTVAVAIVLLAVGVVVEGFCQLPPDDPKGAVSA